MNKDDKPSCWTNVCNNLYGYCDKNPESRCTCYMDYCLWSKDITLLTFTEWKMLVKIEYQI